VLSIARDHHALIVHRHAHSMHRPRAILRRVIPLRAPVFAENE
jgi:hypothetical protein